MNRTFVILYLVMMALLTVASFVFIKLNFTSVLFAVILVINIFLFMDFLKKDK